MTKIAGPQDGVTKNKRQNWYKDVSKNRSPFILKVYSRMRKERGMYVIAIKPLTGITSTAPRRGFLLEGDISGIGMISFVWDTFFQSRCDSAGPLLIVILDE